MSLKRMTRLLKEKESLNIKEKFQSQFLLKNNENSFESNLSQEDFMNSQEKPIVNNIQNMSNHYLFDETDFIEDINEFFRKFYDKNNLIAEVELMQNFKNKMEFTLGNKALCQKFLIMFSEKSKLAMRKQINDNLLNNQIFKELHFKYHEISLTTQENLIGNKLIQEFYKSNKSNINLILTKLIEFYSKINKNSFNFKEMLGDYLRFIKDKEYICPEKNQKEEFYKILLEEEFIKDIFIEIEKINENFIPIKLKEDLESIKNDSLYIQSTVNTIKIQRNTQNTCGSNFVEQKENLSEIREIKSDNEIEKPFNLQEVLQMFVELDKEEKLNKKNKKKKKKNKKKDEVTEIKTNQENENDENEKEIQAFVKKLQASSIHADKISKIKPNLSQNWIFLINESKY